MAPPPPEARAETESKAGKRRALHYICGAIALAVVVVLLAGIDLGVVATYTVDVASYIVFCWVFVMIGSALLALGGLLLGIAAIIQGDRRRGGLVLAACLLCLSLMLRLGVLEVVADVLGG